MNDKILKLAAKSGLYVETGEIYQNRNDYPLTEYMDKFAALIIQECIRVCEEDLLEEYMRKHFAAQEECILYAAVADCCSAIKQKFEML